MKKMFKESNQRLKESEMPKTRTLINFEPEEKERIQEIALRESRSFSNFIVNAVREYIREKYQIDLTKSDHKNS
jgi:predicted transcriptional regulator